MIQLLCAECHNQLQCDIKQFGDDIQLDIKPCDCVCEDLVSESVFEQHEQELFDVRAKLANLRTVLKNILEEEQYHDR